MSLEHPATMSALSHLGTDEELGEITKGRRRWPEVVLIQNAVNFPVTTIVAFPGWGRCVHSLA